MNWKELLKEKAVLVADGAWGTELARLGLKAGEIPEIWNVEQAQKVQAVAESYVRSGSDIILTNTFGGSRFKLKKSGIDGRTIELNKRGVELSKRAAGDKALVFASIGPTGDFMLPLGQRTEEEFIECFAEQIKACAQAGVDGIVIETMTDLSEALSALKAARQVCSLPVVTSMTFDKGAKGFATMMGVTPEQAARELDAAGADIIGSNCGSGIDNMIEVARFLRPITDKPMWIKPNAGMPRLVNGQTIFDEAPEQTASRVGELIAAGANIIGGCCGTTPEHIKHIIAAVDDNRDLARSVSRNILDKL